MKIKKGDTVLVIIGEGKGRRGEVIKVLPKANRLVVKGVNIAKKHHKPQRSGRRVAQAGIIEVELPIDMSNVKLISPSGKPTRVNYQVENSEKKRYSNKYDEVLN